MFYNRVDWEEASSVTIKLYKSWYFKNCMSVTMGIYSVSFLERQAWTGENRFKIVQLDPGKTHIS